MKHRARGHGPYKPLKPSLCGTCSIEGCHQQNRILTPFRPVVEKNMGTLGGQKRPSGIIAISFLEMFMIVNLLYTISNCCKAGSFILSLKENSAIQVEIFVRYFHKGYFLYFYRHSRQKLKHLIRECLRNTLRIKESLWSEALSRECCLANTVGKMIPLYQVGVSRKASVLSKCALLAVSAETLGFIQEFIIVIHEWSYGNPNEECSQLCPEQQ